MLNILSELIQGWQLGSAWTFAYTCYYFCNCRMHNKLMPHLLPDVIFTVVNRAHLDYHLKMIQTLYIKSKKPSLCKQKEWLLAQNVICLIYEADSLVVFIFFYFLHSHFLNHCAHICFALLRAKHNHQLDLFFFLFYIFWFIILWWVIIIYFFFFLLILALPPICFNVCV